MIIRLSSALVGCAMALMVAGMAEAQPRLQPPGGGGGGGGPPQQQTGGVIAGTTAEQTAQALQAVGYSDVQFLEHEGRRHVRAKAGETPVLVIHDNCEGQVCRVLSFNVFFGEQRTIDASYMNAWNAQKRWAKLYRAQNGHLIFAMDALVMGVQAQYVNLKASLFANMLKQLFDFKPS